MKNTNRYFLIASILTTPLTINAQNENEPSRKDYRGKKTIAIFKQLQTRDQTIDHRKDNTQRRNEVVKAKRGRLPAPTFVSLTDVKQHSVVINWNDNTTVEQGIVIERGTPTHGVKGVNYHWVPFITTEEGLDSNIKGKGRRDTIDDQLVNANTQYCYRLRAYYQRGYSNYTYPVCVFTQY